MFPRCQCFETVSDDFAAKRVFVDAKLFGEYRLSDQFGINTTLRYDRNLGDTEVETEPGVGAASADELWFTRYQIFLGARWFL